MSDKPHWPMTELWVDKQATEYKPYKLDDPLPLNAIPQHLSAAEAKASGHWLSVPRKWKRQQRKEFERHWSKPPWQTKSRGWRKHLRKNKP